MDYFSILEQIKKEHKEAPELTANSRTLIVDGLNLFLRVFSAVPSINEDGIHVGGVSGFLRSLAYSIKQLAPTRCIIVFDGRGGSKRRRKLYPEYKNNRKSTQRFNRYNEYSTVEDERQSRMVQLARCIEYLDMLPVSILIVDNVEADDVIAYLATDVLKDEVIIMSTDQDFLQLINDKVSVWSPIRKRLYTPEKVKEDYEIPVSNFLMYKILMGDQSDNIPGIPGMGQKTLIKRFPEILSENVTIKQLFDTAEKHTDLKVCQALLESKSQLKLNYVLMRLDETLLNSNAKLKILNVVNDCIPILDKPKFQLLFMRDKLWSAIPNLDGFLSQNFYRMNKFAKLYNERNK